jgi:hypothetical protein
VEKSAHCEADTHAAEGCAWRGCGCDCHGIRAVVPALPRAAAQVDDAAPGTQAKRPFGLTDEQRSRNERGIAMARAALRGELVTSKDSHGQETSA